MLRRIRAIFLLNFVNKSLDCIATGIVCSVVFPGEWILVYLGIPRGRRDATRSFPSLLNRESYSTRVVLREIKRWSHVGLFPVKILACFCLFSAHVENEAQELPCYVATEKI